ncbi:sugar transferase [Agathobacter ruminis]|uniref:Glucosyltransferase 3 n=2 Tax=Agathobacter ruminis TaxID=1712665 RepID=A0A2G3E681_9FIRM|nr:sugar transferase [Agathobacter ruminis]MDC7301430.1 sugar transferase [Agathobacter ruminis]PHU38711.1 hypothetical protein CSX02_00770 [Agathobacter ruminis]
MNVHVTNLYNIGGTATLAQHGVMDVAKRLGYHEMAFSWYPFNIDNWTELSHRQDGIIAPLHFGDVVILQYPNWISLNYDGAFVDRVKAYHDTKLIIFLEDLQYLLFQSEPFILEWEIGILNHADVLILPSEKMYQFLLEHGLKSEIKIVYQTIWEMPGETCYRNHEPRRHMIFTGAFDRFPFLHDYHGKTRITLFTNDQPARENDESFVWVGGRSPKDLMGEISEGGFGLVWAEEQYFESYYSLNQPHKIGFCLASGIPVIIRKGSVHESFVRENGLGFVVDSLEEADEKVQSITDDEFRQLYQNVANIQQLLLQGAYTTRTLQEAVIAALEK